MLEILHNVNVNWMGRRAIAYTISGLCVLASIVSLVMHGGPRYGIDFTGGTLVEVSVSPAPHIDAVRKAIEAAGFHGAEIQGLERPELFLIRFGTEEERKNPAIINGSRRARISRGSGRPISDVNRLLDQFREMQKMMKKMAGGGRMPSMPGMFGAR